MDGILEQYASRRLLREVADGFRCLRLLDSAAARHCVAEFSALGADYQMDLARALIARRFNGAELSGSVCDLLERYDRRLRMELLFPAKGYAGEGEVSLSQRFEVVGAQIVERKAFRPMKWQRRGGGFVGVANTGATEIMAHFDLGSKRYSIDYSMSVGSPGVVDVDHISFLSLIGVASQTHAHCATIERLRSVVDLFLNEVDDLVEFVLSQPKKRPKGTGRKS